MYFFIILVCNFAVNEMKTITKINEYSFIQNENIIYSQNSYFIPFNDKKELETIIQNLDYFQLIKLQQSFPIEEISNDSRISLITSNNQNSIKICIQNYQKIYCELEIAMILKNNKLQLNQIQQSILLPNNLCFEVISLFYDLILIFCKFDQDYNQIYIIDQFGEIIDKIMIQSTQNCQQRLSLNNDTVIIYDYYCQNSNLFVLRINFQEKNIQLFGQEYFNRSKYEQIIQVTVCSSTQAIINFKKIVILFSIQEKFSNEILFSIYDILVIEEKCQIKVTIGFRTNNQELNTAYQSITQAQTAVIDLMLNYSQLECKAFSFVNENLLLNINNQLIIINNQYLNFTLDSIIDFKQILKLPIIVTLKSDKTLQFYDVNQISNVIKFQHTEYQASLPKMKFNIDLNDVNIFKTSQIILSDTNELQVKNFKLNQESQQFEIVYLNLATLEYNLPIYLVNYTSDDFNFKVINERETICQLSEQHEIVIKKIGQIDQCYILIYYVQNEIVKKQNIYQMKCCMDKQKKELIFQSNNLIDILQSHNFLMLVDEFQVVCFGVYGNFTLFNKRIFQLQSKIVSITDNKFSQILILENNNEYLIYHSPEECNIELIKSQQTDKKTLPPIQSPKIVNNDQLSSQLQLFIPDQNQFDIIFDVNCTYIEKHEFVPKQKLLLTCVQDNQTLTMNLYQYTKKSIIVLYQIPFYNFSIKLPLQIAYNDFQFCVQVKKENKNNDYLFIYNIYKTASSSLIQIIKIENKTEILYLSLLKSNSIFYCQGINCYFKSINFDQLELNKIKETDDLKIQSKIQITLSTLINEQQIKSITTKYQYFNANKSLRFRQNIKNSSRYLYLNDKNQIMGLENIFGGIENILQLNECGKVYYPILPKSQKVVFCDQIFENFCFTKNSTLIYDPFGVQMHIYLPDAFQIYRLQCIQQGKLLKILFHTQNLELEYLIIENWQELNTSNINFSLIQLNIKLDFLYNEIELCQFFNKYLFYSLNSQILAFDLKNNLKVKQQVSIKLFPEELVGNTVFYEFSDDQNISNFVKIFITQSQTLHLCQFQIMNNSIHENNRVILISQAQMFKIAQIMQNKNLLLIKIVYINSESLNLHYLEVEYDIQNLIIISSKIKHHFRTIGINLRDFQIINNILLAFSEEQSQSEGVYFYNLHKQYLNFNFTDYYFKANLSVNHVNIQRYNNSYQVLIDLITNQIQLVDLQYYNYILNQQNEECNMLLSNQVSQFQVKLKLKNYDKRNFWLIVVITVNFSFILYQIRFLRTRNKKLFN